MEISTESARFNMIQQQIRPWDVLDDRVLDVLAELQREDFVPDAYKGLAYADIEVPIGNGQLMLSPKVVGRMLQALALQPGDKVLEIGTGTGYVTACLSRLGGRVISIEIDPELASGARDRLEALGLGRLEIRDGDGLAGPVEGGPFDVIAVSGSVPTEAPLQMLRDQLALDGRLFAIVGEPPIMEAVLITRVAGADYRRQALFETCAPVLVNAPEAEGFVF